MSGPRAFCDRDRDQIGGRLTDLPHMWGKLQASLGERGTDQQQIRSPFGPRLLLREDIDALMRQISETLCSWEERVRDVARLVPLDTSLSRQRDTRRATGQSARTLGGHLDVLLALTPGWMARALPVPLRDTALTRYADAEIVRTMPGYVIVNVALGGADAGLEILHLHYRCRDMLGETRAQPEELLGVPCRSDGCGLRVLRRADPPWRETDTEYWSVCGSCGDQLTEGEYREWVSLNAAYYRAMTTAVHIAADTAA